MSLAASAIAYATRFSWPVFPLKPRTKVPNGWLVPNGVLEATTDVDMIAAWWNKSPDANIGLACGHHFFVLDVDPRNGGDETLGALEREYAKVPETVIGLTGGGGLHILFRMPPELKKLRGSAGDGLDIKGLGGYIVAPPSIHPDGPEYRWDCGAHPTDTAIAEAPQWLLHKLEKKTVERDASKVLGDASMSFLAQCFDVAGWLGDEVDAVRVMARCPWVHEHSTDRDGNRTGDGRDTSTVLFAATEKAPLGRFHCSHGHCAGKRDTAQVLRELPTAAVRVVAQGNGANAKLAMQHMIRWGSKKVMGG